jgi:hypothetical protein
VTQTRLPLASTFEAPLIDLLKSRKQPVKNADMDELVARKLELPAVLLAVPHGPGSTRTEFAYRVAWARSRLMSKGLIERVAPSTWRLAQAART